MLVIPLDRGCGSTSWQFVWILVWKKFLVVWFSTMAHNYVEFHLLNHHLPFHYNLVSDVPIFHRYNKNPTIFHTWIHFVRLPIRMFNHRAPLKGLYKIHFCTNSHDLTPPSFFVIIPVNKLIDTITKGLSSSMGSLIEREFINIYPKRGYGWLNFRNNFITYNGKKT